MPNHLILVVNYLIIAFSDLLVSSYQAFLQAFVEPSANYLLGQVTGGNLYLP